MAFPQFSELFVDNLTDQKIDEFILEKDLEALRSLCQKFRDTKKNRDELDGIRDDKIGMVLFLWMRNEELPDYLNLTWDEPYDSGIKKSIAGYLTRYPLSDVRETPIYRVMKNPGTIIRVFSRISSSQTKS